MNKITDIFRCFAYSGCLLLMALLAITPVMTSKAFADPIQNAMSNTDYSYNSGLQGLQAMNGTHDFSVTAHSICRYIDVAVVPGGNGLLVPFNTPAEWIKGAGTTGFIATSATRSFVKLDFCRPVKALSANYVGPSGISNPANLIAGQSTIYNYTFDQKRIDTRSDSAFTLSLIENRQQDFNMSRKDCLGNTTYPDGTVRNPCFTWSWIEQITATFMDAIGKTRTQASTAATAVPVVDGTNTWSYGLKQTACIGPNGLSNDGRPVPQSICPPPVQPPVLRSCPPQAHNTHHWVTISTGNVRDLHDCSAGYIEDPTRRYTFDVQADYWCFDSVDYPTGPTREVNGVTSGMCKPIINGRVGPVNDTSVDTLTATSSGLCSAGIVADFTTTATGWSWTCQGINTGINAYGNANQHMDYNLACNTADSSLGGAGQVSFTCDKFNGSSMTCAGTQSATSVSGCCKAGQPNNQSFSVLGTTVPGCDLPAGACTVAGTSANYSAAQAAAAACVSGLSYTSTEAPIVKIIDNAGDYTFCQNNILVANQACPSTGQLMYRMSFVCNASYPTCAPPTCPQGTESRTSTPCPSGQTGTITEQRTKNVGSVCEAYGSWTVMSNTCAPTCTSGTEDQTVACDAGYTGNKVQRRTTDSCGAPGAWVDYNTSACIPAITYGWDTGPWTPGTCP